MKKEEGCVVREFTLPEVVTRARRLEISLPEPDNKP